jgi:membrane protein YqaA with SNARE-associated domain
MRKDRRNAGKPAPGVRKITEGWGMAIKQIIGLVLGALVGYLIGYLGRCAGTA